MTVAFTVGVLVAAFVFMKNDGRRWGARMAERGGKNAKNDHCTTHGDVPLHPHFHKPVNAIVQFPPAKAEVSLRGWDNG